MVNVIDLIIDIGISFIALIIVGFLYFLCRAIYEFLKEKEESKIVYGSEFTVKACKALLLNFFIFIVVNFLGMIAMAICLLTIKNSDSTLFWIPESFFLVLFLAGCLFFSIFKYDYIVVKEEGIYVNKLFKKTKFIKYSDIAYIENTLNTLGRVACYNIDSVLLFEVYHHHLGIEQLVEKIQNKADLKYYFEKSD
ncbi:MAG: hypothetical protein IKC48_00975 [Clostridia bacterium]|nr:hypothetical protein [Clostridia bacterium]